MYNGILILINSFRMFMRGILYLVNLFRRLFYYRTPQKFYPSIFIRHSLLLKEYYPNYRNDLLYSSLFSDLANNLEIALLSNSVDRHNVIQDLIESLKILRDESFYAKV